MPTVDIKAGQAAPARNRGGANSWIFPLTAVCYCGEKDVGRPMAKVSMQAFERGNGIAGGPRSFMIDGLHLAAIGESGMRSELNTILAFMSATWTSYDFDPLYATQKDTRLDFSIGKYMRQQARSPIKTSMALFICMQLHHRHAHHTECSHAG